jgi:hypothetical protein
MTDAIRKKVLRIMELATLINPTKTQREVTGNRPTVFVNFSGHCCILNVQIHPAGYPDTSNEKWYMDIRLYGDRDKEELDGVLCDLEALYAEWKDKAVENV